MKAKALVILSVLMFSLSIYACNPQTPANQDQGAQQNQTEVQSPQNPANIHNPADQVTDANMALQYLKEGNNRFVNNTGMVRNSNEADRNVLKDGQKPFAVIVTCSDSRVDPAVYFDQKLGDIFVIRNAGNIADETALGSIEYAVEHLHAPLVVMVGHGKCGAVTAAVEGGGELPDNLNSVIAKIKKTIKPGTDVDTAIHDNINGMVNLIKNDEIIKHEGATVVGAYYDIVSGNVVWQ